MKLEGMMRIALSAWFLVAVLGVLFYVPTIYLGII